MRDIDWKKIAAGDRDAFNQLVESELDSLLESARHELGYYVCVGDFPPSYMTPEELVGQAMVNAWDARAKKPAGMEPRAWLHAMLLRTADALAARRREIQRLEALSLEEEIPKVPLVIDPTYDDDEAFYEWFQPDEALKWEDTLPSTSFTPEDFIELMEATKDEVEARAQAGERPEEAIQLKRRAALLRYRFGFSLEQVCRVLGKEPARIGPLLEDAHGTLGEAAAH